MKKSNRPAVVLYPADRVWGAACAAQRINGTYLKDPEMKYEEGKDPITLRQANKHLMRDLLFNPADSRSKPEDLEQGKLCRAHYQGLIFKELSGTLNSGFLKAIYAITAMEEFQSNAFIQLAQLAAAPQSWIRDVKREANIEKAAQGKHVGALGEKVTGSLEVTDANFSNNYGIFFIHGFLDGNGVFFAHKSALKIGEKVTIKGTVKAHRDNFVTQLNRVKVVV